MERFLDITPGSVSVLGLMNDKENQVQLLIDREVLSGHEFIGCHPCINTSSLKIRTRDLLEIFLPYINQFIHESIFNKSVFYKSLSLLYDTVPFTGLPAANGAFS